MDLPTLSVTNAQAQRLLAAFGDQAGYRRWLKRALLDEVDRREARRLHDEANTSVREALEQLRGELPDPDPDPGG
jgi:hypothetical protein